MFQIALVPAPLKRVLLGTKIEALNLVIRHFDASGGSFNKLATTQHILTVPPGKFWVPLGGVFTRGICTATAVVVYGALSLSGGTICRVLVLASGASDVTDIPDNALRVKPWILTEGDQVSFTYGAAQNSDSNIRFTVLEGELK